MKLRIIALVLVGACALAFGVAAQAQNVPQQFVISGKAAEKIQDFTTINLNTAERIVNACEAAVTAHGGGVHSLVILDKAGNHVYMDRMDGQGYVNIVTAEYKARTALMGHQPSKAYANSLIDNPSQEFEDIQLGFYPVSGGLPIIVDKQEIGVIGAGGYRPNPPVWSDEICAHTGLVQVIGPSVAPLLEDKRGTPRAANPGAPPPAQAPRFAAAAPPKTTLQSDWVVGGQGAANVFDANQISLAAAKKLARTCRDWATSKGGAMSLYVIDNAGEIVHMERMDGEVANDNRKALLKAQTALKTRAPTSIVATQLQNNPAGNPRQDFFFGFFEEFGGIPIVVDGQMIGAVGVSGGADGTGDARGDESCAIEGLKATFGDHATLPVYPAAAAPTQTR